MPWIFLCLMLANAVYFGWNFVGGQPQQAPLMSGEADSGRGQSVVLLSERPELSQRSAVETLAKKETSTEGQSEGLTQAPQCYFVGPFASDGVAKRYGSQMKAEGFSARTETRKTEEKDLWVFIPPFTNREKAEERLRDLKARGVEGFVVREGVFVNSISLNHFSRKELAQTFLRQMQSAGISVEYREIKRSGLEFWVYLTPGGGQKDLRATIDGVAKVNEGMKRENAACEE